MKMNGILALLGPLVACAWLLAAAPAAAQPPSGARGGPGWGGPGRGGPPDLRQMLQRLDKNKDGELAKEEVPDPMWSRLSRADANDDGTISKDELRKIAARVSEMRRRGGQGRGDQGRGDKRPDAPGPDAKKKPVKENTAKKPADRSARRGPPNDHPVARGMRHGPQSDRRAGQQAHGRRAHDNKDKPKRSTQHPGARHHSGRRSHGAMQQRRPGRGPDAWGDRARQHGPAPWARPTPWAHRSGHPGSLSAHRGPGGLGRMGPRFGGPGCDRGARGSQMRGMGMHHPGHGHGARGPSAWRPSARGPNFHARMHRREGPPQARGGPGHQRHMGKAPFARPMQRPGAHAGRALAQRGHCRDGHGPHQGMQSSRHGSFRPVAGPPRGKMGPPRGKMGPPRGKMGPPRGKMGPRGMRPHGDRMGPPANGRGPHGLHGGPRGPGKPMHDDRPER